MAACLPRATICSEACFEWQTCHRLLSLAQGPPMAWLISPGMLHVVNARVGNFVGDEFAICLCRDEGFLSWIIRARRLGQQSLHRGYRMASGHKCKHSCAVKMPVDCSCHAVPGRDAVDSRLSPRFSQLAGEMAGAAPALTDRYSVGYISQRLQACAASPHALRWSQPSYAGVGGGAFGGNSFSTRYAPNVTSPV